MCSTRAQVHLSHYYAKAENFSLMMTVATMVLISLVHQQARFAGPARKRRHSRCNVPRLLKAGVTSRHIPERDPLSRFAFIADGARGDAGWDGCGVAPLHRAAGARPLCARALCLRGKPPTAGHRRAAAVVRAESTRTRLCRLPDNSNSQLPAGRHGFVPVPRPPHNRARRRRSLRRLRRHCVHGGAPRSC